jgi:predicted O-methyltransferase YrrM
LATGPHVELLAYSALTYVDYARAWGWDLVLSTEDLARGRPASWGKVTLVRELLDRYEWVLWLDADAVVVDGTVDIGSLAQPGKDFYVAEVSMSKGRRPANTGVFLVRSTAWSREFLDRVWAAEQYVHGKTWEQGAILAMLGYRKMVRPEWPNADLQHVEIIDPAWNSTPADPQPAPRIVHYAGVSNPVKRLDLVLAEVESLRALMRPAAPERHRPSAEPDAVTLSTRDDLPSFLEGRGFRGRGVEVGVLTGAFSARLLSGWSGEKLISVDPWLEQKPWEYADRTNVAQGEQELRYRETCGRLAQFGERSQVWRMKSREAAARIEDESLDFVYIDARHDEASVTEDLCLWWPKVRPGGVVAGHDYLDGARKGTLFGVKTAVDRFLAARGLAVAMVTADDKHPSWLAFKPARSAEST